MNVADELLKLQELRQSGGISEEEFAQAKAKLLTKPTSGLDSLFGSGDTDGQTRRWGMFLHLSQLLNFAVPMAGIIVPIVIWQMKKEELPGIDEHGKIVVNWIISTFIYWIVSAVLLAVFVGIPMMMALVVLMVVFPIIGGLKANNGEVWKYPLSISFFK